MLKILTCGPVYDGVFLIVNSGQVSPFVQQESHQSDVAGNDREVQGREALLVGGVEQLRGRGQHQLGARRVRVLDAVVEGTLHGAVPQQHAVRLQAKATQSEKWLSMPVVFGDLILGIKTTRCGYNLIALCWRGWGAWEIMRAGRLYMNVLRATAFVLRLGGKRGTSYLRS